MTEIIIGALGISNLICFALFLRARKLNKKVANERNLAEWVKVAESLEQAGRCVVEIKAYGSGSLWYREP